MCAVGDNFKPETAQYVNNIITNIGDIDFFLFRRTVDSKHVVQGAHNAQDMIMAGKDAGELIAGLIECHYILLIPAEDYFKIHMSASIPLAFNTLTRLITPQRMLDEFKYTSGLASDNLTYIGIPTREEMQAVYNEGKRLWDHRNTVYATIVSDIVGTRKRQSGAA